MSVKSLIMVLDLLLAAINAACTERACREHPVFVAQHQAAAMSIASAAPAGARRST